MMLLVGATALSLALLQASINVPRDAMRDCFKSASASAKSEKVAADDFESYARDKCSAQIASLRGALTAFNQKNGMAKKAAAEDADLTIDDYLASPIDHYRFSAGNSAQPASPPQPTPPPPKSQE